MPEFAKGQHRTRNLAQQSMFVAASDPGCDHSPESGTQGKASGRSRSAFASMASLANPRSLLIPTVQDWQNFYRSTSAACSLAFGRGFHRQGEPQ
jgi:hypothetical protein